VSVALAVIVIGFVTAYAQYQGEVGPLIEQPNGIPSWIKLVFQMWTDDLVTDEELISALIYLMQVGIIVL